MIPWTPGLPVTWGLFQFYKTDCVHLVNSQSSTSTDRLAVKHFLMPQQSIWRLPPGWALKAHPAGHWCPAQLCRVLKDMLKSEWTGWHLEILFSLNDLVNPESWVQWVQDMLHFLGYHSGAFARNKSCKGTCRTCFEGIHIEIVRLFPDKKAFDRCKDSFLFWSCCALFLWSISATWCDKCQLHIVQQSRIF